jgi:hypothetical protein
MRIHGDSTRQVLFIVSNAAVDDDDDDEDAVMAADATTTVSNDRNEEEDGDLFFPTIADEKSDVSSFDREEVGCSS